VLASKAAWRGPAVHPTVGIKPEFCLRMKLPRNFFKALAIGAPAPLRELPLRLERMIHFVPPHIEKVRAKVPELVAQVDVVLGNLEDAIPADAKEAARNGFIAMAQACDFGETGLWTRINALNSPWVLDDICEIVAAIGQKLDVVMLPKVEGAWDIHYLDQLLAQLLLLGLQRRMQLLEAARAERVVRRPIGLVEGPPGGVDRPLHLSRRGIGNLSDDLLGRRIDVVEAVARVRLDQLAVDQHPRLRVDLHCIGHGTLPLVVHLGSRGVPPSRDTDAAAGACLGSPSSAGYLTLTSSSKLTGCQSKSQGSGLASANRPERRARTATSRRVDPAELAAGADAHHARTR